MYRSKAVAMNGYMNEDAYFNSLKEFARNDIMITIKGFPLSGQLIPMINQ